MHLLYESTNEDTTLYYNVVVLPEIRSYESTFVPSKVDNNQYLRKYESIFEGNTFVLYSNNLVRRYESTTISYFRKYLFSYESTFEGTVHYMYVYNKLFLLSNFRKYESTFVQPFMTTVHVRVHVRVHCTVHVRTT